MSESVPSTKYINQQRVEGTRVTGYDFARHGLDVATARLAPTQARLAMFLFAPHQEWQHRLLPSQLTYREVPLGTVRMTQTQVEQAAHPVVKPILRNTNFTLCLSSKNTSTAEIGLPTECVLQQGETMKHLYTRALHASLSPTHALLAQKIVSQWLAANSAGTYESASVSARVNAADFGLTCEQIKRGVDKLMQCLGEHEATCEVTSDMPESTYLRVTLPRTLVQKLNPTLNAVLYEAGIIASIVPVRR